MTTDPEPYITNRRDDSDIEAGCAAKQDEHFFREIKVLVGVKRDFNTKIFTTYETTPTPHGTIHCDGCERAKYYQYHSMRGGEL
jgi:hypothetical protein